MSWDQLSAFAQSSPILTLAFVGLTLAVVINEVRLRLSGIPVLSPAAATRRMNSEEALVVDVSPATDFAKAHILGSISMPLSGFDPERHKVLGKAKARPLIVVCRAGTTARDAAKKLKKAGYADVSLLDGGIAGWRQADLPLAKAR